MIERRPGLRRALLVLALAAGVALRLAAARQQTAWLRASFPGSWPLPLATLSHDGTTYLRQARNGLFTHEGPAAERWFAKPYYRPPGASLYFDAALNATGFSPGWFFLVQSLLAVGAYTLLFAIARRHFPPWVAWTGLAIVLLHPVLIFYDASLEDSVPAVFLLALGLFAFSAWQRRGGAALALGAGAAVALSVTVRPNFLVIPPLLAALAAWRSRGGARLLAPALLLLPLAAVLALTARQNAVNGGGRFSGLLVATVGENLFWGNNAHPYYRISFMPRKGAESPSWHLMGVLREKYGGATDDETYLRAALAYFREDPRGAAAGFARKALRHLSAWEIPRNLNLDYSRQASPILRLPYVPYGLLAGLFALGLAGALRADREPLYLAAPVLCAVVTEVVFFNASRYRSVAIPFMMPLALAGAARLAGDLAARRLRPAAGALALLALCAGVGAAAVGGGERRAYLSAEYHKAALVSLRWEDRWANLRRAEELDPDSIEVFDATQYYLIQSGEPRRALELRERHLPACVSSDQVCRRVADSLLRRARERLAERGGGA